jgi:RNA polymerase sigma factor (sigma-70 family)
VNEQDDQVALSKNDLVQRFYAERYVFLRYIHRFAFKRDVAEEVFQEACLRFLTSPASFQSFPFAASYLYRIIFSIAIALQQRQKRILFIRDPPELVCEAEPQWHQELIIEKLDKAIGCLSLRERQLLDVYLSPQLKCRQKSKLLNLPPSTYVYQIGRVIAKLRKHIIKPINKRFQAIQAR